MLREKGLLADRKQPGEHHFCVSDHAEDFSKVASMFLGQPIRNETEWIRLETIESAG